MWVLWGALVLASGSLGLTAGWYLGAHSVVRYLRRRYPPVYDLLMERFGRRIP